jgi:YbdK family carboxylate-amine ligase
VDLRSFGVEEELLLVDPGSGTPRAVAGAVIRLAREHERDRPYAGRCGQPIQAEFQREQLETATRPCLTLDELAGQVRGARLAASDAAHEKGVAIAALATSPVPVRPSLTPSNRYLRMADAYAMTADEQLTCGCHVHVNVSSPDEGVGVLDRIRPWLPLLLAMSANSPFWQGRDTGYASFRHQAWGRWPSEGPTELFGCASTYRATVEAMLRSRTLLDEGMIYFDARLSSRYPTVEIRVADVCLMAADTVLVAAVARALVETAVRAWRQGDPPDPVRTELLRLAMWRASRSGLRGELPHPGTQRPAPAPAVLYALVDHVAPALEQTGDLCSVRKLLEDLLRRGTGADLQRDVYARTGDMTKVVRYAVARTLSS